MDASGTLTMLHAFNGSDGRLPYAAGLILASDGNFYGTTYHGGAFDDGTVFKVDASGTLTTLHAFAFNVDDGGFPIGGLIQARDGNFYGTTPEGGAFGAGVIFRLDGPLLNTPSGTNVAVSLESATLTFSNVTTAGTTTLTTIDSGTAVSVPGGFAVSGIFDYQIQTTAIFTGPVTIALLVPGPISQADFNSLIVLHNDNGILVDVTASSPPRNYATSTIYAVTSSFSPFYLVRTGQHISPLFDQTKSYKSGSTVPIKLKLLSAANANTSSAFTTLTVRNLMLVGGSTSSPVIDAGNANPDSNFRYDSTLGGYIFNLSTRGLPSGTWTLSFYAGADHSFIYLVGFEVK